MLQNSKGKMICGGVLGPGAPGGESMWRGTVVGGWVGDGDIANQSGLWLQALDEAWCQHQEVPPASWLRGIPLGQAVEMVEISHCFFSLVLSLYVEI